MASDKTANTNAAQTQTDTFSVTARYVRITVTTLPDSSTWASFFEFRVFGGGTVPTNTPGPTNTTGPTSTKTNTPTTGPTNTTGPTPTRTNTPVPPTATNTPSGSTCSPVTSTITAPFTFDGAGTFCWQSTNLGSYINSWNTTSVTVNGVNETNLYIASGSYPAKINGYWYVSYSSAVSYGHFEAK